MACGLRATTNKRTDIHAESRCAVCWQSREALDGTRQDDAVASKAMTFVPRPMPILLAVLALPTSLLELCCLRAV